ncbi:MAG: hypothetical protein AAF371_12150 [Pseudomonadota bacterium]
MRYRLSFLVLAAALAGTPALAQDGTERSASSGNPELARALASVNNDGPEVSVRQDRGAGFFGRGFYITTDRAGTGTGATRVGGRENLEPRKGALGETILRR